MDKPIFTFRKNATEEVRASIRTFEGRSFINLQVWAEKDTGHLEFLRTPKGLSLSVYILPELKKAVLALEKEASRLGLLEPNNAKE